MSSLPVVFTGLPSITAIFRLGGMDFGWDHPFDAVELIWDRDADVVYVTKTHRLKEASPSFMPLHFVPGARNCRGVGQEMEGARH
jgi:hypothetical protein